MFAGEKYGAIYFDFSLKVQSNLLSIMMLSSSQCFYRLGCRWKLSQLWDCFGAEFRDGKFKLFGCFAEWKRWERETTVTFANDPELLSVLFVQTSRVGVDKRIWYSLPSRLAITTKIAVAFCCKSVASFHKPKETNPRTSFSFREIQWKCHHAQPHMRVSSRARSDETKTSHKVMAKFVARNRSLRDELPNKLVHNEIIL